ncbi:MAG: 16S rRNA (cytosine(1402)-N(4))-methyltransferase RsmH [Patescibacteria group bacterium]|nr:16S rRNA (cytosine(1402)-N(4))-methyltransferase RsmH [Patescibacteria group bacterium]
MSNKALHQPVMTTEAISGLNLKPNQWYIDATFGRGGHTAQILANKAKIIALDFDQKAIEYGEEKFATEITDGKLILLRSNFAEIDQAIASLKKENKVEQIKGILFDFGTSQDQLKSEDRGFSFDQPDSELDMRMDQRLGVKAKDLLMMLSKQQLTDLFYKYGGEKQARKIAQAIDYYRGKNGENKIETVGQLVEIVEQVKTRFSHLHPATKIFQALRIAVNAELENIEQGLSKCLNILDRPARIVTISFHQGEDRIAKMQFKQWKEEKLGKIITKKPIKTSQAEIDKNPAARSAKLRIFELTK